MIATITSGLNAALGLAFGRGNWQEALEGEAGSPSVSFLGPLLATPLVALSSLALSGIMMESEVLNANGDDLAPTIPSLIATLSTFWMTLSLHLAFIIGFAHLLGAQGSPWRYTALYNWMTLLIVLLQTLPLALFAAGIVPMELSVAILLIAMLFSIYARWRLAFSALRVHPGVAIAIVSGTIFVQILAGQAMSFAFGLTPAEAG